MTPIAQNRQTQDKKPSSIFQLDDRTKTIIIVACVAVVVAGALTATWFLSPQFRNIFRKTPTEVAAPPAPVEEEVAVAEEEVEPLQTESSSSVEKGFYIIVGSFRNEANAARMVTNCSKDIALQVLYFNEIGFYRVSAGKYDNIHKAYNDAFSIRDLDGCASAWILENR